MARRGVISGLQKSVCAVAKIVLGKGAAPGVSMYDLGAEALAALGYAISGAKAKDFVISNRAVFDDFCRNHKDEMRGIKEEKAGRAARASVLFSTTKPRLVVVRNPSASDSTVDVASDEFLKSYKWRQLRMVAIKQYGAKCQCCGASAATGSVINVDHIKPRRLFPDLALDLENLQILCHECNHGKGNWDQTDWRNKA